MAQLERCRTHVILCDTLNEPPRGYALALQGQSRPSDVVVVLKYPVETSPPAIDNMRTGYRRHRGSENPQSWWKTTSMDVDLSRASMRAFPAKPERHQ